MDKQDKQAIIKKVKALLRLADPENNDAKGEMANAMRKAQAFLRKYNLSMSELEREEENSGIQQHQLSQKAFARWERHLCKAIALLLDIDFFTRNSWEDNNDSRAKYSRIIRRRIVFLGSTTDCAIAVAMFHIFKKEMRTLYRTAKRKDKWLDMNRYCLGMADFMCKKVPEYKYEEMSQAEKSKYGALIVVKKNAIDRYVKKNLNLGIRKSTYRTSSDYHRGYVDGKKVNLRIPKTGIQGR